MFDLICKRFSVKKVSVNITIMYFTVYYNNSVITLTARIFFTDEVIAQYRKKTILRFGHKVANKHLLETFFARQALHLNFTISCFAIKILSLNEQLFISPSHYRYYLHKYDMESKIIIYKKHEGLKKIMSHHSENCSFQSLSN